MKRSLFALFLICSACGKSDFPKYSLISGLRVLTIKALSDQGEVNPGTTVTLQPVVSDMGGGGRTISVTVTTCMDPGVSLGAPALCPTPDSTTTSSFASSTLSAVGTFTGEAPSFTVAVPASLPLFTISPVYVKYNGLAYLVIYTLTAPDGTTTTAIKRLVISDPAKTAKNKNPAISSVSANGAALSASNTYSSAGVDLAVAFSQGAEQYTTMNADGSLSTRSEDLTTTWYYTDGTMKFQRTSTGNNHWDPGKPATRSAALVVVTHDGRGGEDYKVFEFN